MDGLVAPLAADLTGRIGALTTDINALQREIAVLVRHLAPPPLAIPGAAELTAAKIVAETAAQNGSAYLHRRIAAGDTKTEALRSLKRRLSDIVYRALSADGTTVPIRQAA
jgi:hypothetical protein